MTTTVGVLNLVLGLVYLQYGTMTVLDMRRHWGTMGFSHFGAAWIFMAFTCGPHHVHHGVHVLLAGWHGGALDVLAVAVGFPAGVIWFLLRVEAFTGGAGDRVVTGTPRWLLLLPAVAGIYIGALGATIVALGFGGIAAPGYVAANLLLVPIYSMVGFYVIRTQLANRRALGGWSVSGLALAVIFPTCAVMHGIHAYYVAEGRYAGDAHAALIDWLAVPAALYFLWVVQALARGTFRDWNSTPRALARAESAAA